MNASEQNKPNQQERVIPKLRFPEFQTALGWSWKTLDQVCTITNGKSNAQDHIENGKYPLFDRSEIIKASNDYLFDCEVVIIPGEGMKFIPKYYKGKFNLHQRAYALKDFIINGKFVYYSMLNNTTLLSKKAVQSTVLSLRLPILKNFPIIKPETEEQQKIADCLFSLDELIELQEQKLATLKQHKKGLMQQLFPSHHALQAGRVVYPKLRFPQFRNYKGWEVVELGSLFNLNHTNERIDLFDKNKVLTVKLHTLGVVKNERTDTLSGGANYFHRRAGDFIFSKIDFLNGAFGIIPQELDGFCSSSDIPTFSFKKESNPEFFIYWLKANYLNLNIERTGTSNTLKRISTNALFSMRLPIPIPKEQQAIVDCLSSLDNLINEQNEQINRLKTHKRGLMQQLFPST